MRRKKEQGFSLLEVIIAIAVLSLLITPIFASFAFSLRGEQRAMLHTLATYTAQMKMEEAYGMDKTALMARFNTTGPMDFVTAGAEAGPEGFYYSYTTVPMPGTMMDDYGNTITYADLNLYEVTVVVGYAPYDIQVTITDIFHA